MFVDTGVWVAYANSKDNDHTRAKELLEQPYRLVTTWPIVWETVTVLNRDVGAKVAVEMGMRLTAGDLAEILELTSTDHVLAWDILRRFANRRLSAADATGCAIIRRLNIAQVASFDQDFAIVLTERTVLGRH